jgi:hypothetical protein
MVEPEFSEFQAGRGLFDLFFQLSPVDCDKKKRPENTESKTT